MKFKPLNDRVLIRRAKSDAATPSGIVIPGGPKHVPDRGTVLAVGPGLRDQKTGVRLPMEVKVGDDVFFNRYAGAEVTVDGEQLFCVRGAEISGVVA